VREAIMNRTTTIALVVLAALAFSEASPTTAHAQRNEDFTKRSLTLGLRAGLYLPGLFSEMSLGPHLSFELGVLLPVADKRLALVLDASYASGGSDGTVDDPRIGESGGSWSWEMSSQQLFFSFGPLFRFMKPGETFVPYLGVFGRMYLLKTTVDGSGNGEPFGEHEETSTEFGFAAALGGELRAGPGAVLLELQLGYAPLGHRITGDVSTGALSVQLGYRLFL
jgi:hypothetical protein